MKCNHCEADFNLSSDLIFEETISQENEIREKYFICPVCKHHYYVLVTDKVMFYHCDGFIKLLRIN